MTRIVRWRPVRHPMNLFNEFDRFFERPYLADRLSENWGLALDVAENEDGYVVKASVPGVAVDDLDITVEDNVLTIKGEIENDESVDEETYHIRERRFGHFSRSVRFPVEVNADNIEAAYENGVLTLSVPKAEEVKPKRIEVKVS